MGRFGWRRIVRHMSPEFACLLTEGHSLSGKWLLSGINDFRVTRRSGKIWVMYVFEYTNYGDCTVFGPRIFL